MLELGAERAGAARRARRRLARNRVDLVFAAGPLMARVFYDALPPRQARRPWARTAAALEEPFSPRLCAPATSSWSRAPTASRMARSSRGCSADFAARDGSRSKDLTDAYLACANFPSFSARSMSSATSPSAPPARRRRRCSSSSSSARRSSPALRLKQGKGQPIRERRPAVASLTKKGTPTMGGLMILVRPRRLDPAVGQSRAAPMSGSCCS